MDTGLMKKLLIKPGDRVLLLNAPPGYQERLIPLPDGGELATAVSDDAFFDLVQLFVRDQAEVEQHAATAMRSVKPGGVLWISYPKQGSGVPTDLTRDNGWDAIRGAGWIGVSMISIDDVWSAMRFRPRERGGQALTCDSQVRFQVGNNPYVESAWRNGRRARFRI
jgi:hypothetical protein